MKAGAGMEGPFRVNLHEWGLFSFLISLSVSGKPNARPPLPAALVRPQTRLARHGFLLIRHVVA